MTPQSFSYATVSRNNMIYCPPYGLNESLNFMIKINPLSYEITKIPLDVDSSKEKWEYGIVVNDSIVFLPYNESKILILDTINDSVEYVNVPIEGTGKYIKAHRHKNKIISLPYGEWGVFNHLISFDIDTKEVILKEIVCPIDDQKKWHTTHKMNLSIKNLTLMDQMYFNLISQFLRISNQVLNQSHFKYRNFKI